MRRTLIFLGWLGVLVFVPRLGHSQMSEEQKRQMFLRAREDIRPVPRASASPTPRPKPKSISTPTPRPTPEATPKKAREDDEKPAKPVEKEEDEKPAKSAPTPEEEPTPKSSKRAEPEEADEKPVKKTPPKEEDEDRIEIDKPAPTPTPAKSTPTPTPKPDDSAKKLPPPDAIKAPIVIEKSGLEEDQGFEPAPKSSGGWFKRYRYLSPSVRKAIDNARVKKGRWKYIIIHNSGTRQGNARVFDSYHRKVRKMQNGLAYHFVIGNGSSSGDGEIEIGPRWTKQINGGHVASDYLNNIAIGICLVGDFNRDRLTKAQVGALDELIAYLRGRVGKIKGKPAIVVPHKKINPKPTDCPGDRFPYSWLQQKFGS